MSNDANQDNRDNALLAEIVVAIKKAVKKGVAKGVYMSVKMCPVETFRSVTGHDDVIESACMSTKTYGKSKKGIRRAVLLRTIGDFFTVFFIVFSTVYTRHTFLEEIRSVIDLKQWLPHAHGVAYMDDSGNVFVLHPPMMFTHTYTPQVVESSRSYFTI